MDEVPCIFVDDLNDAQRRALTLADNKTAMMTGFDEDMLAYELDVLAEEFDMAELGFADEIGELSDVPGADDDGVPEFFERQGQRGRGMEPGDAPGDVLLPVMPWIAAGRLRRIGPSRTGRPFLLAGYSRLVKYPPPIRGIEAHRGVGLRRGGGKDIGTTDPRNRNGSARRKLRARLRAEGRPCHLTAASR